MRNKGDKANKRLGNERLGWVNKRLGWVRNKNTGLKFYRARDNEEYTGEIAYVKYLQEQQEKKEETAFPARPNKRKKLSSATVGSDSNSGGSEIGFEPKPKSAKSGKRLKTRHSSFSSSPSSSPSPSSSSSSSSSSPSSASPSCSNSLIKKCDDFIQKSALNSSSQVGNDSSHFAAIGKKTHVESKLLSSVAASLSDNPKCDRTLVAEVNSTQEQTNSNAAMCSFSVSFLLSLSLSLFFSLFSCT